jgi:hypothetical protein
MLMSTVNRKFLKFFVQILKPEIDGSNWVIFKDCFAFAAAATSLEQHINGTRTPPNPPTFTLGGPFPLTVEQTAEPELFEGKKSKWLTGEAVINQAITSTVSDSLFIEIHKEVTAHLMWEAIWLKQEKKSCMVTVDLHHRPQAEKCPEHSDVRAHLNKLQMM